MELLWKKRIEQEQRLPEAGADARSSTGCGSGKKRIGKYVLIGFWIAAILWCCAQKENISVEHIVDYVPRNLWLAAMLMVCFFALKSLSMVFYAGILYTAAGVLFSLPAAIGVNLVGSVVMVTLPYLIGRHGNRASMETILVQYPRMKRICRLQEENDVLFAYLARIAGLPSDVVSLYMGASGINYKKYLAGSLAGLLPAVVLYPVIGMHIQDRDLSALLAAVCASAGYTAVTMGGYLFYRKRKQTERGKEQK